MIEIRTEEQIIAELRALPKLPEVYAVDMLHAQGWRASAEERALITAKGDLFEELGMPRELSIVVRDVYTGVRIGTLAYSA